VYAVRSDAADLSDRILLFVVDDVIGSGGTRELRLLGAADGGDGGGV
jgi:hypothetical protein